MNYDKLKSFISSRKPHLVTLGACAVMFVVGFGTGKTTSGPPNKDTQQYQDYTAKSAVKPGAEEENAAAAKITNLSPAADEPPATTGAPTTVGNDAVPGQPCLIKGNISGSNKIYHIKGGASYEKTSPEKCFNTEAEAVAAGFRKAKR
jgi:micrococcal nuclease